MRIPGATLLHGLLYALGLQAPLTQTTPSELKLLSQLAANQNRIVEIGVYEGVASRVLRKAMPKNASLVLIDPFPKGRMRISVAEWVAKREVASIVNGEVTFDRRFSHDAAGDWSGSIDLLYYDAHNGYEGVRRDFETWSALLAEDGLYLLHTSRDSEAKRVLPSCGTVRFTAEIEQACPEFQVIAAVDSISIIARKRLSVDRRNLIASVCHDSSGAPETIKRII